MRCHIRHRLFGRRVVLAAASLAGLLWACADKVPLTYPATGVPLLFTNSTCLEGQCDSLRVIAFPTNQPGMTVPWAIDLGVVATESACLTMPPVATYTLVGYTTDSTADTTLLKWTPSQGVWLGAFPPSSPFTEWHTGTQAFVPARAAGWSVALPAPVAVPVQPGAACTP